MPSGFGSNACIAAGIVSRCKLATKLLINTGLNSRFGVFLNIIVCWKKKPQWQTNSRVSLDRQSHWDPEERIDSCTLLQGAA